MVADAVFVDTNVLVYAGRRFAPRFAVAAAAIDRIRDRGGSLWVSPQVLREYLAAVTRPQGEVAAVAMKEAIADLRRLRALFGQAQEGPRTMDRLLDLLAAHRVGGKQVHDAHLVATMLVNGIGTLLTFNVRDFQRFSDVIRLEAP